MHFGDNGCLIIDCHFVYVTLPVKLLKAFRNVPDTVRNPHRSWSLTPNPGIESSWTPHLMDPVLQHNFSYPAALQMLWSTDEGHQSVCKDIGCRMKLMSSEGTLNLLASLPVSVHLLRVESVESVIVDCEVHRMYRKSASTTGRGVRHSVQCLWMLCETKKAMVTMMD